MIRLISPLSIIPLFLNYIFGIGSYEILNTPQNARSLGLSNSIAAHDVYIFGNNPANISIRSNINSFYYSYLPGNMYLLSTQNIIKKNKHNFAVKISLLNYGKIIDSKSNQESYAYDGLLEIGYKKELVKIISLGISGGYLISNISGYSSHLIYSKIGIRNRLLKKKIGIGLSVENIGYIIKSYTGYKENLPTLCRMSVYYKLKYIPLTINTNLIKRSKNNTYHFVSGLELKASKITLIRLGFNSNRNQNFTNDLSSDLISGISFGIGVRFKNKILDLGFMNIGPAGFIIGVSLSNK